MSQADPDPTSTDDTAVAQPTTSATASKAAPEPELPADESPADRRRPPHPHDYTSAVYGSVLAATVVVSAGDLRSPGALAVLLVVSGIVFWLAHVYAATVSGRHGGWHVGSIRASMRHEWPVAFAAIPPAIAAAVCGLIPAVSPADGVWAALIVAIVEQQLWGYAAVRNARLSGNALSVTVLLNVVMGFIIIALKFAVGH